MNSSALDVGQAAAGADEAPATSPSPSPSPAAQVRAARAQGAHRFAPVRFRLIEALSRRAEAHGGEARRLLDARLLQLLVAYRVDLEAAQAATSSATASAASEPREPSTAGSPPRGPIAALVDQLAQHAAAPHEGMAAATNSQGSASAAPDQLKTMRYFSGTWSKLSADRRLKQSMVKLPENAGPLNSHQLVHRALTLMRDVSPAYLNRFMSYVDTLSWLEQATAGNAASNPASRSEGTKKSGRGKAG
ncbi:MAG: DUF2894 domain-containing protein [Pseudomonadota bacterium]